MSRVINPDSAGKLRGQLTKGVVQALTELLHQQETGENAKDIVAFASIALLEIADTINISVAAWEKRGYWVKADRFRLEWEWSRVYGAKFRGALLAEDWGGIAQLSVQVLVKLSKVKAPGKVRGIPPWAGAWGVLKSQSK